MQELLTKLLQTVKLSELTAYMRLLAASTRQLNGCLTANTVHGFGYGQAGGIRAHRLSWMINNGSIPRGMFVCHTCDNPACHEITHLFLGTPSDNAKDKAAKGRSIKGSAHPGAVLTEDIVRQIKTELEKPSAQLAHKYRISRGTIDAIKRGETWKHVTA